MSQFHRHFPELAADLCPAPSVSVERPDQDAPDDIPWHTEKDVDLAVARMTNWAQAQTTTVRLLWDLLAEDEWRSLARVGLGMKP